MITGHHNGKALMVIEKLDSQWVTHDVQVHIQSGHYGDWSVSDGLHQDFACVPCGAMPLPSGAKNMKVGERVWIAVSFTFTYTQDYWGEYDAYLEYRKERVLKRRRAPKYMLF